MEIFTLKQGTSPLLISMPHSGTYIPDDIKSRMTDNGKLIRDTDWHLPELYGFDHSASIITATHSRYVVDLNRSKSDETLYKEQVKTGLLPLKSFSGENLYINHQEPDKEEIKSRIEKYWQPYHQALNTELIRIKEKFGYAILYDAHSIEQEVPRLFDGKLPDLNLGTVCGESCPKDLEQQIFQIMQDSSFSSVLNDRFVGGYITRNYGDQKNNLYSLQMEIVRSNYMQIDTPFDYLSKKADNLQKTLKQIIHKMDKDIWANLKN